MFKNKEIIWILIITLLISFFYFCTMLYYTMGHLSAPLDDTFIFLQYTWQLIHGYPFQYNTGDPPTTGCTSIIYPFFLIPGFLLGLDKTAVIYYTFSLGVVFLSISGWLVFKIGKIFNYKIGVLMCLLFLFNGPIVWVFLSGMDAGLFTTTILTTMYSLLLELEDENQRYKRTILSTSFMTLARPEGFILSVVIFCSIFLLKKPKNYYFLIPIGLGIGQIGLNYIFNGTLNPNTMTAKSVLTKPNVNLLDMIATAGKYYAYILKDIFSGFNGEFSILMETNEGRQVSVYFAPFSLIFFLFGAIFLILKERSKFGIIGLSSFFIGTLAVATALPFKWHWHRYLIPYYSIFLIFTLLGIYHLSDLIGRAVSSISNPRYVFYGLTSFLLSFGFLSTIYFGVAYGKNCKDIYFQQMTLGRWIDKNLPKDAIIALNDLGALKYFGDRYVIDMLGLGTKGMARSWVNGAGSVYEYLENLNSRQYPQYFIIYPNWFVFDKLGMLQEEIAQFKLFQPTIAGSGAPMVVYKIDWRFAHSGDEIQSADILKELEGYKLVDRVDVADVNDELKHKYKFWESEPGMYYGMNYQNQALKLSSLEEPSRVIIDAGRMITSGERMIIDTEPGKDLKIIKRTMTFTPLEVYINDKLVGVWNHRNADNNWTETVYNIPGRYIISNKTKVRFEIHRELKHHYTCFSSHYWFYQR